MSVAGTPVLVTGATGFLGGALARRLALAEGARVTAVGRRAAAAEALRQDTTGGQLLFRRADLAQRAEAEAACAGQAIVFHCAAQTGAWGPYAEFHRNNVVVTHNIIAGSRRAGARLVHVSTPSLCFADQPRLNVAESDPLPARQLSHYAATKLLAEQAVNAAVAQGLSAITIRPRAIFGPRDTTLLPRLSRPRCARATWRCSTWRGAACARRILATFSSRIFTPITWARCGIFRRRG
jgi:nucleoside-diphosphate-sugar epimerase